MTLTERTNAVLAKLRASDTPKDKALIVAIEALRRYAFDLCDNDGQGCPCATDSDLELVGIIKTLEESL